MRWWMSDAQALARGLLGGTVATAAMSGIMLAAQRIGWLGEMPPEKITDTALATAGATALPEPTKDAVAAAAHFGFGATAGALFGWIDHRVPRFAPTVV